MSNQPLANNSNTNHPWHPVSLQSLRNDMQQFSTDRNWDQFHTPRNLLIALTGEVGELAELFQWRGEVAPGLPDFTPEEKQHVGEEMSDVLLYLVRMADRCDIDLAAAVKKKIEKNAAKYPVEACKGKSDKYTAYTSYRNVECLDINGIEGDGQE
jgi:dCTP diphosphatase